MRRHLPHQHDNTRFVGGQSGDELAATLQDEADVRLKLSERIALHFGWQRAVPGDNGGRHLFGVPNLENDVHGSLSCGDNERLDVARGTARGPVSHGGAS